MNLSLFPKNEDWGTGDEALDSRLNTSLKKAATQLSLESVAEFYFSSLTLKTRAYNPAFAITIELVAKALLYELAPAECNDVLFKKMRGHYFEKERVEFSMPEWETLMSELKSNRRVRYKDQIDFSLAVQPATERNPFVSAELLRAPFDLQAKILFKEFRQFLESNNTSGNIPAAWNDPLFLALKEGKNVVVIGHFAEIWFDRDQLFSFTLFHR